MMVPPGSFETSGPASTAPPPLPAAASGALPPVPADAEPPVPAVPALEPAVPTLPPPPGVDFPPPDEHPAAATRIDRMNSGRTTAFIRPDRLPEPPGTVQRPALTVDSGWYSAAQYSSSDLTISGTKCCRISISEECRAGGAEVR